MVESKPFARNSCSISERPPTRWDSPFWRTIQRGLGISGLGKRLVRSLVRRLSGEKEEKRETEVFGVLVERGGEGWFYGDGWYAAAEKAQEKGEDSADAVGCEFILILYLGFLLFGSWENRRPNSCAVFVLVRVKVWVLVVVLFCSLLTKFRKTEIRKREIGTISDFEKRKSFAGD